MGLGDNPFGGVSPDAQMIQQGAGSIAQGLGQVQEQNRALDPATADIYHRIKHQMTWEMMKSSGQIPEGMPMPPPPPMETPHTDSGLAGLAQNAGLMQRPGTMTSRQAGDLGSAASVYGKAVEPGLKRQEISVQQESNRINKRMIENSKETGRENRANEKDTRERDLKGQQMAEAERAHKASEELRGKELQVHERRARAHEHYVNGAVKRMQDMIGKKDFKAATSERNTVERTVKDYEKEIMNAYNTNKANSPRDPQTGAPKLDPEFEAHMGRLQQRAAAARKKLEKLDDALHEAGVPPNEIHGEPDTVDEHTSNDGRRYQRMPGGGYRPVESDNRMATQLEPMRGGQMAMRVTGQGGDNA